MSDVRDLLEGEPPTVEMEAVTAEAAPQPETDSIFGVLKRKREEAEPDEPLVLPVAAYDDMVAVRFTYPEGGWERLRANGRKLEGSKDPLAELWALCDLLAACCDEILFRDEGDWTGHPDGPLRFNKRLADSIGLEMPEGLKSPVRFIVRNFYSPRASETAVYRGDTILSGHAVKVSQWLEGELKPERDRFVGES